MLLPLEPPVVDLLSVARLLISDMEFLISVRSRLRAAAFISDEAIRYCEDDEACDEVCVLDVICPANRKCEKNEWSSQVSK